MHVNLTITTARSIPLILSNMKQKGHQIIDIRVDSSIHILYIGMCKLKSEGSIMRRMDILMVPMDELGAALIYFTGNELFNRRVRKLASSKVS
jgi:DNA polymerase/3'-5' exonuclease PolX